MAARLWKDEAGRSGMVIPLLFYHRRNLFNTTEKAVSYGREGQRSASDTHGRFAFLIFDLWIVFSTHLLEGIREAGKLSKSSLLA